MKWRVRPETAYGSKRESLRIAWRPENTKVDEKIWLRAYRVEEEYRFKWQVTEHYRTRLYIHPDSVQPFFGGWRRFVTQQVRRGWSAVRGKIGYW